MIVRGAEGNQFWQTIWRMSSQWSRSGLVPCVRQKIPACLATPDNGQRGYRAMGYTVKWRSDPCQNLQTNYSWAMSTMNISLPDTLKAFVDEQVCERGYGSSSEYVRELIRSDQDRRHLRGLLLQGAASAPGARVDARFLEPACGSCNFLVRILKRKLVHGNALTMLTHGGQPMTVSERADIKGG